jgi:hypothetical protein
MPDASSTFAVRLLLSPALIGTASAIARRCGPTAGGWFSALPLTSGPVVLVLALERGAPFAAEACVGIVLAIVALAAYVLVYCRASRRLGWTASGALACAAYMASLWPLGLVTVPLPVAFLIACAAVLGARLVLPHEPPQRASGRAPAWDIPLRMATAAALVWLLAQLSGVVGARVSGLLAPFPVAVTIMSTFTHRHDGAVAARQFLRSLLAGLVSFAVFFLAAGVLLPSLGLPSAFLVATLGALVTHALAWRVAARSRLDWPLVTQ